MVKAASVGTLAACALLAACSPFGGATVFNCDDDSQCSGGVCQPERVCSFADTTCPSGQRFGEHAGSLSNTCVGDMPPDAAIDAPTMCEPNTKACFQHAVETCRADGNGFDPAMREACALACTTSGTPMCVGTASNIPLTDQQMCNAAGNALALTPTGTATVTINQNNITCDPTCNGAQNVIPRTASVGTPALNFFCLASINIPSTVTVTYGDATAPVALFSHGAVVINGTIDFDGGNARGTLDNQAANDTPGAGGPGGFTGGTVAAANDGPGQPGGGPAGTMCGGRGGAVAGTGGSAAGGGGGGGGNSALGGDGGNGRDAANTVAAGGLNGLATGCSTAEARPLIGGAAGGSGGDGGCGQNQPCGWPGGGGGGALQIVSRSMISGSGTITASGGNGKGEADPPGGLGGGGGGGAGGMILLEAPKVAVSGPLRVDGGTGGAGFAGNGGAGATGGTATGTDGPDAANNQVLRGGGGGGGAAGRIRINATNATAANCSSASPAAACTTGALRTAP